MNRAFATRALIVIALVALAALAWKIAPVLMLGFAGVVLATVLRAGSVPLARRLRLSPAVGVALVIALLAAAVAAGGYLFGKQIAEQADAMGEALADATARVQGFLQRSRAGAGLGETLRAAASPDTLAKVARGTFTAFGAVADLALVLFLAVYFAADPHTYRNGALALLPPHVQPKARAALDAAGDRLHRWLLGQLGAMATVGILIGAGLAILGVPLALPLGVLAALLEFVPVVGPFTSLVIGVLVAFAQGPQMALYAGALYAAVLFVEGNVIIPLAQKWAVEMPPALGLLAIAIFGVLFGLPGVLFAMPLLVVLVTLVQRLYIPAIAKTDSS
jgi:predicted PurR-regulated permease PerM